MQPLDLSAKVRQSYFSDPFSLQPKQLQPGFELVVCVVALNLLLEKAYSADDEAKQSLTAAHR